MKPLTPAENHRYLRFKKIVRATEYKTADEIRYALSRGRWLESLKFYGLCLVGIFGFLFTLGMGWDMSSKSYFNAWDAMGLAFWFAVSIAFISAPRFHKKNMKEVDAFTERFIVENSKNDG